MWMFMGNTQKLLLQQDLLHAPNMLALLQNVGVVHYSPLTRLVNSPLLH
jgi:hypothetical protein